MSLYFTQKYVCLSCEAIFTFYKYFHNGWTFDLLLTHSTLDLLNVIHFKVCYINWKGEKIYLSTSGVAKGSSNSSLCSTEGTVPPIAARSWTPSTWKQSTKKYIQIKANKLQSLNYHILHFLKAFGSSHYKLQSLINLHNTCRKHITELNCISERAENSIIKINGKVQVNCRHVRFYLSI